MKKFFEDERDSLLNELAMLRSKTPDVNYGKARAKHLRDTAQILPLREASTLGNITMREFLEQEAHAWETTPSVMRAKAAAGIERALDAIDAELKEISRGR